MIMCVSFFRHLILPLSVSSVTQLTYIGYRPWASHHTGSSDTALNTVEDRHGSCPHGAWTISWQLQYLLINMLAVEI